MAGLTAQMWQAKCYEEQGKIGAAIGIYKSCSTTPTPGSVRLQRNVGYFHIVALAKRKEYALAADEADQLAQEVQPPRGERGRRRAWACSSSWPRTSTPRCPR